VFVNVYNLFDNKDATNVYADTGSPTYTTTVRPNQITYNANRIGTVNHWMTRPEWYTWPRQIQVGLSVGF